MSDNTEDVRTKITPEDHEFLSMVALASGAVTRSELRPDVFGDDATQATRKAVRHVA